MKRLKLKKNEHRRLQSGHLWIFSNEIDSKATPLHGFEKGELVAIETSSGHCLGLGYVNPNTLICSRLLCHDATTPIDTPFFINRIQSALALRERMFTQSFYRLVFGESDFLPGLVIDRFNNVFIIQITTAGMEQ